MKNNNIKPWMILWTLGLITFTAYGNPVNELIVSETSPHNQDLAIMVKRAISLLNGKITSGQHDDVASTKDIRTIHEIQKRSPAGAFGNAAKQALRQSLSGPRRIEIAKDIYDKYDKSQSQSDYRKKAAVKEAWLAGNRRKIMDAASANDEDSSGSLSSLSAILRGSNPSLQNSYGSSNSLYGLRGTSKLSRGRGRGSTTSLRQLTDSFSSRLNLNDDSSLSTGDLSQSTSDDLRQIYNPSVEAASGSNQDPEDSLEDDPPIKIRHKGLRKFIPNLKRLTHSDDESSSDESDEKKPITKSAKKWLRLMAMNPDPMFSLPD